jgi:hypothetical protein
LELESHRRRIKCGVEMAHLATTVHVVLNAVRMELGTALCVWVQINSNNIQQPHRLCERASCFPVCFVHSEYCRHRKNEVRPLPRPSDKVEAVAQQSICSQMRKPPHHEWFTIAVSPVIYVKWRDFWLSFPKLSNQQKPKVRYIQELRKLPNLRNMSESIRLSFHYIGRQQFE